MMVQSTCSKRGVLLRALLAILASWSMTHAHAGEAEPCQPEWVPAFGGIQGTHYARSMVPWDDGTGPSLFVCSSTSIWKWNGIQMDLIGSDVDAMFHVIAVFDDGTGQALYVGGDFTTIGGVEAKSLAKWDGRHWSPVGHGVEGGPIRSMCVFDQGTGPKLYLGGGFTSSNGMSVSRVVRWDGVAMESVGSEINNDVYALAVFNDERTNETALYAGGTFTDIQPNMTRGIARWDGVQWSSVGTGISGCITGDCAPAVLALTVYDDGTGPSLFAGGQFISAGQTVVNNVARWNGTEWLALNNGVVAATAAVHALHVHEEGGNSLLCAGGVFSNAQMDDPNPAYAIAFWDGTSWRSAGSGLNASVRALTTFDDGSGGGPELHIGGSLYTIRPIDGGDDIPVIGVAKLSGGMLQPLGSAMNSQINTLEVFDDGTGPALFAGGNFTTFDGTVVRRVAKWNGVTWLPLGDGTDGPVYALEVFDDGSGPSLYAGGEFTHAGGVMSNGIAKWNGSTWDAVNGGVSRNSDRGVVYALKAFDGDSGPALFVGGNFDAAGGVAASHVAQWDGRSWSALDNGAVDRVLALEVFDDGNGPRIVAGARFAINGVVFPAARWNGQTWETIGQLERFINGNTVHAFAVQSGPAGSQSLLYAAGLTDGVTGHGVHKLVKNTWTLVGGASNTLSYTMSVYDDGTGSTLYVGGQLANGPFPHSVSRHKSIAWEAVNSPLTDLFHGPILTSIVFDDGNGPALFVAGRFTQSPVLDSHIAKYQGCPIETPLPGDANSDGVVDAKDLQFLCVIIGATFGDITYFADADFNDDGEIDELDLAILDSVYPRCPGDSARTLTFAPPPDGVVDAADLAYLLAQWGTEPSCADFVTNATFAGPPDGIVDGADLAVLIGAWGACE